MDSDSKEHNDVAGAAAMNNSNSSSITAAAAAASSSPFSPDSNNSNSSNAPKLYLSDESDSGHESGSPPSSSAAAAAANGTTQQQSDCGSQPGAPVNGDTTTSAKVEGVSSTEDVVVSNDAKINRVPASVFLEEVSSANDPATLGLPTTFKTSEKVAAKTFKVPSQFACNVCNILMTSETQLAGHHQGMKHQRKLALMEGREMPLPKKKVVVAPPLPEKAKVKAPPRVVITDVKKTLEDASSKKSSRDEPMSDGEVVSDDSDEKIEVDRIEKGKDGRRYMLKSRRNDGEEKKKDLREKLETKKHDRENALSSHRRRSHRSPSKERSGRSRSKRSRSSRSPKSSRTDKKARISPPPSSPNHRRRQRQRRSVSCSSSVSLSSIDRLESRKKKSPLNRPDTDFSMREGRDSKLFDDDILLRDVEKQLAAHRKSFDRHRSLETGDKERVDDFRPRDGTSSNSSKRRLQETAVSRSKDVDHEAMVNSFLEEIRSPRKKKKNRSSRSRSSTVERILNRNRNGRSVSRERPRISPQRRERESERSSRNADKRSRSRDKSSRNREINYEMPSREEERRRSDRSRSRERSSAYKKSDSVRRPSSRDRIPSARIHNSDDRKDYSSRERRRSRSPRESASHRVNSTDRRREDKSTEHRRSKTTRSRSPAAARSHRSDSRSHRQSPSPSYPRTSSYSSDRPTGGRGYKDKMARPYAGNKYIPLSQRIKDSMEPVVGLGYVSEWLACSRLMDPYYECDLCQTHGKVEVMMSHLLGKLHRENFLERKERSYCRDKARSLSKTQLMSLLGKYDDRYCEESPIETIHSDEQYPWPNTKSPWDLEMGGTGKVPTFARENFRSRRSNYNKTDEQIKEEKLLKEQKEELERVSAPVVENVKPNLVEKVTSKEQMLRYFGVLKLLLEKTSSFHLSRFAGDEEDAEDFDKMCTMARYGLEMSEKIGVTEKYLTDELENCINIRPPPVSARETVKDKETKYHTMAPSASALTLTSRDPRRQRL